MIAHIVLFTPRPDLTADERRALANAFEQAVRAIPAIREIRIGRRVRHGAGDESGSRGETHVAILGFDDLDGLRGYLRHPAHEELGRRFRASLASVAAYDFDTGGLDALGDLV